MAPAGATGSAGLATAVRVAAVAAVALAAVPAGAEVVMATADDTFGARQRG